jgi:RimJ/RimL family protein N-acetyltransferase
MATLETPRLILRRWTLDDVLEAAAIYGDPATMQLFAAGKTFTPAEVAASLAAVIAAYDDSCLGNYAVLNRESGRILGHCGVHRSAEPAIEAEADWLIRRDSWRQGYAAEAALSVIARVFTSDGAAVISGVAHSENVASIALMRKLGMQYVRNQSRFDVDSVVYNLTSDRFFATLEHAEPQ